MTKTYDAALRPNGKYEIIRVTVRNGRVVETPINLWASTEEQALAYMQVLSRSGSR